MWRFSFEVSSRSKWRRSYSRKQGAIPFVHLAVRRIIHWIYEVPDPISLQGAAGSASVGKNIEDYRRLQKCPFRPLSWYISHLPSTTEYQECSYKMETDRLLEIRMCPRCDPRWFLRRRSMHLEQQPQVTIVASGATFCFTGCCWLLKYLEVPSGALWITMVYGIHW